MPVNKIKEFLRLEAASGVMLFLMTLVAMIFVNSPASDLYLNLIDSEIAFNLGDYSVSEPFIFWVNDGLMTIFFLLVGLELKREFIGGELSSLSKIVLPGVAAIGGMILPAIIYVSINMGTPETLKGWAIPVATDIAFALGVLAFFSKRIPLSLKVFLLALAVFDDLGAILIIATVFSHGFSILFFLLACLVIACLWVFNHIFRIKNLLPYVLAGFFLWVFVLKSGIHASISGVALALMIPIDAYSDEEKSPLHILETFLHPWVAFLILPIFAFSNAGLSFDGVSFETLLDPIVLGITLGLFVGKQVGVMSFIWVMVRFGIAKLPENTEWLDILGVALLCGIGFTMSLFIGTLAFKGDGLKYIMEVRLGVLLGSIISAVAGSLVLHLSYLKKLAREN